MRRLRAALVSSHLTLALTPEYRYSGIQEDATVNRRIAPNVGQEKLSV